MSLPAHWYIEIPELAAADKRRPPLTPDEKAARNRAYLNRMRERRVRAGRGVPGLCDVCEEYSGARHWDHDHATGFFRGYLCHRCNAALGFARDDPERLRKLATYLELHRITPT